MHDDIFMYACRLVRKDCTLWCFFGALLTCRALRRNRTAARNLAFPTKWWQQPKRGSGPSYFDRLVIAIENPRKIINENPRTSFSARVLSYVYLFRRIFRFENTPSQREVHIRSEKSTFKAKHFRWDACATRAPPFGCPRCSAGARCSQLRAPAQPFSNSGSFITKRRSRTWWIQSKSKKYFSQNLVMFFPTSCTNFRQAIHFLYLESCP